MNLHLHVVAKSLGVPESSPFSCAVCGVSPFGPGGYLGSNFADYAIIANGLINATCAGCERILGGRPGDDPPPLRTVSFVADGSTLRTLERADMWSILRDPPSTPFVLSWSESRQKHHALRAGISGPKRLLIGSDLGVIDFSLARDSQLVETILDMISKRNGKQSFTRSAIADGTYHPASVSAYGADRFRRAETIVSIYRMSRRSLLDLLLWCAPSEEREGIEDRPLIEENDATAARLLGAIASILRGGSRNRSFVVACSRCAGSGLDAFASRVRVTVT